MVPRLGKKSYIVGQLKVFRNHEWCLMKPEAISKLSEPLLYSNLLEQTPHNLLKTYEARASSSN